MIIIDIQRLATAIHAKVATLYNVWSWYGVAKIAALAVALSISPTDSLASCMVAWRMRQILLKKDAEFEPTLMGLGHTAFIPSL